LDSQAGTDCSRFVVGNTGNEIVELFHAFFEEVRVYCAYRLFGKDLAEDAVADVFTRLADKWPTLQGRSRADIRKWLYGTASNVAAKYLRDADRQKQIVGELTRQKRQAQGGMSADDRMDWPTVYQAISRLSPADQSVLTLRFFKDLNSSEIAATLGMTRVGVRVRLHRAIKALHRELGVKP
jgi:RNA polymerase sigma-70 factor (ECF subfamily)